MKKIPALKKPRNYTLSPESIAWIEKQAKSDGRSASDYLDRLVRAKMLEVKQ